MNGGIRVITGEMVGLIRARRREESRAVFVLFRNRKALSVHFWKVRIKYRTKKKNWERVAAKMYFHFHYNSNYIAIIIKYF